MNNIDEFAVTGGRAQGNSGTVGEGHSEDSEEIISNRIKGDIQISMSLETQSRTLHDESHPTFFFFLSIQSKSMQRIAIIELNFLRLTTSW